MAGPGGKGPGGPGGKGPGRHGAPIQKPKDAKVTLRRLLSYISKQRGLLVVVFFCVLISAIANLAGSYMLRPIINTLEADVIGIGAGTSTIETAVMNLAKGIAGMACIYMLSVGAQYLQARIMIGVSQSAIQKLRNDLFQKIQKLPVRFFDTNNHGEVMSRFTNDVDAIAEMLDSIPIFARRIAFRQGLGVAVLAVAAGKVAGSLVYFVMRVYEVIGG